MKTVIKSKCKYVYEGKKHIFGIQTNAACPSVTPFNGNVAVTEGLWVFLVPNRGMTGERLLPTLLLLPALPKHSTTDTELQLIPALTSYSSPQGHTQKNCSHMKSLLADCLVTPGCCGSQSWGPASLTPCFREPALLLAQHPEPAQLRQLFCPGRAISSPLNWACPGCRCTRAGELWYPASALSPWRHPQLSCFQHLQQALLQKPLSARLSVTLVQQYPADDAAEV